MAENVRDADRRSEKEFTEKIQADDVDAYLAYEKTDKLDTESQKPVSEDDDEDIDIKVVNELATMEDDPTLRSFTFRAVLVGTLLACLSSSVYQLMLFKPVGIPLTDTFMLLIAYIVCTAWAKYLPEGGWLNPGPFNVKEHTCIFVMVSSANHSAYATYILSAQELYYNNPPGPAGSIFLLFATQLVGYGIAGQLRPYLVYPANMIWPLTLPTVSLLRTFNSEKNEARWRTKFFFMIFGAIFVYEFIPQYMFPMLGGISIVCLAKNDSVWVTRIFGGLNVNEGLGILSLSFDWNHLSYLNPLIIPLWVQMNIFFGIILLWIIVPLMYYTNVWDSQAFPFLSNSIFAINQTTGKSMIYPQRDVLNEDNSLNHTKLEAIGIPQYSGAFALNYIIINLAVTATIAHVALYYGKDIWSNFRTLKQRIREGQVDVHMRLMSAYKEVPSWWYYAIYVAGIGLNIGIAYANHSQLPWWGVIFAIGVSTILSLPLNMIQAITGSGFGLNVLTEMICGFVLPGYPIANMYFKTLGYNTMSQAGKMAQDLKIGHYLKVPPKMVFLNQIWGTVIGCIFNYIVNDVVVKSKREILLDPIGDNVWNGSSPQTINSAAITWGAIGPMAMFGPGTKYYIFLWAFVIGFFVPVPFWLLSKKFPKRGFELINVPMILIGLCILPGSNSSWITVSFGLIIFSQWYMKRRHREWFVKYNYLISTALDSATSLMVFFIAFALMGGASGKEYRFPTWWGNRADIRYMDQCCMNCPT
ncbi:OPT family small oligopeptide transporter [Radiomyces spectabilis]|uniref:OPT family small oligopeptide transporter n=1 Tax=Radiomyces spectabilis TaxID=64574 RepID=UPI002220504F|nr:OPT family small oligopeptide transporter [Radiomyces spectabilis]KAI8370665.1 OPT family small oligopeptide transporter [Radiomyces spectabilis]